MSELGRRRAKKLSAAGRREIASKGGRTSWAKMTLTSDRPEMKRRAAKRKRNNADAEPAGADCKGGLPGGGEVKKASQMAPRLHVAIEYQRGGGVRLNPRKMKVDEVVIFHVGANGFFAVKRKDGAIELWEYVEQLEAAGKAKSK
jgi:hypothetical protein